jgi:cytoskeletal protein RodZ
LTPADVHKAIRIRERYLTALEEERWDMLPGDAYTKGFLRTYAEFLGLHGQLYVDEFNASIARHEDELPLLPPRAREARPLRRGVLGALAGIVAVGAAVAGLAAWRLGGTSHPPSAGKTKPSASAVAPTSRRKAAKPKRAATPALPVSTLISAARGDCWLLVRAGGPNGAIVYEGTLQQGQVKRFPLHPRLWVRMGRPSAVDIHLGKKIINGLSGTPENLLLAPTGSQPG